MKKKLLFLTFVLSSILCSAQFDLKNYDDDTLVSDGQTLNFSETNCEYNDSCNWRFKVTNTSTEDITMRIFVDDMLNSDGSNVQFCFLGTCLYGVSIGTSVEATIAAGASTGVGNYFWNQNPTSTTTQMSWTLRFQAFDAGDNAIGSPLSVTYNFDPNLSVEDSELTSVDVFPTQVKNELNVSSNQDLTAEFYDILGKKVKQVNVSSGESKIDVSNLSPQLYIIRFRDDLGNTLIRKVIVE